MLMVHGCNDAPVDTAKQKATKVDQMLTQNKVHLALPLAALGGAGGFRATPAGPSPGSAGSLRSHAGPRRGHTKHRPGGARRFATHGVGYAKICECCRQRVRACPCSCIAIHSDSARRCMHVMPQPRSHVREELPPCSPGFFSDPLTQMPGLCLQGRRGRARLKKAFWDPKP